MKRILTYGTFDLLHFGHIEILRRAKELGDYLVVAVSTDEFNAIKDKNVLVADDNFAPEQFYINLESEKELKDSIKQNLSKYEWQILCLYLQGFTYKDISEKLNKQPKSIDNALQRIKTKVSNYIKGTEK